MITASRRAARPTLGLLVLLATIGGPPTRAADTAIQPGAQITAPAGCTMNFVFHAVADPTVLYIGTAGHCVGGVGDRVSSREGPFGTVVFKVLNGHDDFTLIEIDPDRRADVNPAVRRWGGPSGVTTADTTRVGDLTLQYGYGIVYGSTEPTRSRAGVLWNDNDQEYHAEHPAIFGDSGGPVLHGSGRALGITATIGGHLMNGPTVERVLNLLAAKGIHVALVTAAFTGP